LWFCSAEFALLFDCFVCLLFLGGRGFFSLQQAAISQVGLNDDIADGCHDELDLTGVCCASVVGIDLLGVGQVQADEPV